jgi:hypothetical protein
LFAVLLGAGQDPTPPAKSPAPEAPKDTADTRRTDLNLVGVVNTQSGESRRNENVHFNLIDNNAVKEMNIRLGVTATLVQPFRAEQNQFGAEFGAPAPPSPHQSAIRTQNFRGSAYWSHNNSLFSARSFFQVGAVQPARDNDYGFQFGLRLWHGASLAAEANQNRIRGVVNGNVLVPRADERTPLSTDPAVRSVVERYLRAYPAQPPNRTDINERALNTNAPQVVDRDNAQVRLEQAFGTKERMTMRHQFTGQDVDAFQLIAGQNPDTTTRSHGPRVTWNRQWRPNLASDFTAAFDRIHSLLVPEPNAVGPLVLTGMAIDFLGPDETLPIDRVENRFRYAGGFQYRRGSHTTTWGFDLLRRQLNGREHQAHRGIVFFSADFGRDAITNIRLGTPSRYFASLGSVHRGFRSWDLRFHFGDSFAVRPGLTLSYGLRYQPALRPSEVNGLSEIPYDCDCNNLAPRFGFAWNLPRRGGVLRGAYGIHYGEIFPVTYQQVRFNPPQNIAVVIPEPYLADPLRGLTPEDLRPDARVSVRLMDPELASPYSHQYNFSWEPGFGGSWKLQLGYVGSRTHKLPILWYTNRARPVPGIPLTSATVNLRRPDPRYFDIYRVVNGSRGYYDAGKATLLVPRWRGLNAEVSYWFSKAIDLGSNYTNTAYDRDGRLSRSQFETPVAEDMKGLSTFDQTHALLLRVGYETPRWPGPSHWWSRLASRWSASVIYLAKTGTPFEVQSGSDGAGVGNVDGQNGDRVHVIDPSVLGRTIGHPDTAARRLPRSAFAFMRAGELRGSIGHHVFRKGPISNVNAALSRTFTFNSDWSVQFRAESINFFNTPQFAEPGRDLSSPSFGFITNTLNDGRTFRFTLRLSF